ncbi:MAG: transcription termination factor Rho [Syntrophobacteraceae bacterium]
MENNVTGVLRQTKGGAGVLRNPSRNFRSSPDDVFVPAKFMRQYGLVEGVTVTGPVQKTNRFQELATIELVCNLPPEAFKRRTPYTQLTAVDPCERFNLSAAGDTAMRVVDLIAPIGKGTRGLIVSPPKVGKTTILEQISRGIRACDPQTRIIVLLVDERPEEVTHFRRAVDAEVLASSIDEDARGHVELSELMFAHIRSELECGQDVVLLLDSLTRMSRAFNAKGSGTNRIMSGGIEAGTLEIPRRLLGLARKIEGGGSVTIIATVLVDTGSRMDSLIFQEFKGTGNSEIILDRALADARIYPAINIHSSGTRKEEVLYEPDDFQRLSRLRRILADQQPKDAMSSLLNLMEKYPTNEELLRSLPPVK